jgi:hypothetical protein
MCYLAPLFDGKMNRIEYLNVLLKKFHGSLKYTFMYSYIFFFAGYDK